MRFDQLFLRLQGSLHKCHNIIADELMCVFLVCDLAPAR